MSAVRRSRSRNGKAAGGESYSRADGALWDDAYLLKLFNEQLDSTDAVVDSRTALRDGDDSALSSATELSSGEAEERATTSASSSSSTTSQKHAGRHGTAHVIEKVTAAGGVAAVDELPADVQALVQSFYRAGFEAGRYVGSLHASTASSRKRQR
ncbi:hypothetical protein NESM_000025200 [Novymonas esmeraldas]|uniref:Uncharacterized protein n=1 Tax=Novymonas esmeraldas TaxID=1808958 RepID=A0AAW0F3H0_9TRYP